AGTLVMPTWCASADEPFDPKTTRAAPDLGVLADLFWRLPGVLRTEHLFAFAAVGPRAAEIVGDPLPIPPHIPASPVGRVHELAAIGHAPARLMRAQDLVAVAVERLKAEPLL